MSWLIPNYEEILEQIEKSFREIDERINYLRIQWKF